jgi:hypothetical protein
MSNSHTVITFVASLATSNHRNSAGVCARLNDASQLQLAKAFRFEASELHNHHLVSPGLYPFAVVSCSTAKYIQELFTARTMS